MPVGVKGKGIKSVVSARLIQTGQYKRGRMVILEDGSRFILPNRILIWHDIHKGDRVRVSVTMLKDREREFYIQWWHKGQEYEGGFYASTDLLTPTC